MTGTTPWDDLSLRLGSSAVLVTIGLTAVAIGGDTFHAFVAIICGAMVWELCCILGSERPTVALNLGVFAGVMAMIAIYFPMPYAVALLILPAIAGYVLLTRNKVLYLGFVSLILYASFGMMLVRDDLGFFWMLWLASVVVATDVAGYLVGRSVGGPKLWKRVSPTKTWSGTIAGWTAALLIGIIFSIASETDILAIVVISVFLSLCAQLGDIGESAVKRRVGVKDSSNIIPGHGGLLDRFDGMLGASISLLILGKIFGLPTGVT
ncbi:MAG: CDP-archaeol synthase [Aestuariivita sp.]|nr:CDP-archaeol synthase [Aestuariivita sp.]